MQYLLGICEVAFALVHELNSRVLKIRKKILLRTAMYMPVLKTIKRLETRDSKLYYCEIPLLIEL
jgi:hypothetical protein